MMRFALLLALASTTAATMTGFYIQRGEYESTNNQKAFGISCNSFQVSCGDYCVPKTAQCCSAGTGAYCPPGRYCVDGGCCPAGETCSGGPTRCEPEFTLYGSSCIPEGAILCVDGTYCDPTETCTNRGTCANNTDDVAYMLFPRKGSGSKSGSAGGSTGSSGSSAISPVSPMLLGVAIFAVLFL